MATIRKVYDSRKRAPSAHGYMAGLSDPQMTRAGAGRRIQHAGSPGLDQHEIDSGVIIFCDLHEVTTLKMEVNGRAAIVGVS